MKVVSFPSLDPYEWDRVCEASEQAWLFHRSDWVSIETAFSFGVNHSFGLIEGNRLVGVQPLYFSDGRHGTGGELLLHSGFHRHTGLALMPDLESGEEAAARNLAMQRIFAVAEECNADRIQLNAHNLAPENLSAARREIPFWVEEHGFYLGICFSQMGILPIPGMATCSADQIVALHGSEDALFSGLDESCRRAVRKAKQHELTLVAGEADASVEQFYQLAEMSAKRTGEALAPIGFYRDIWLRLAPTNRSAVLFVCYHGKRVAGLFLLLDKGSANFMAGVSDPEYLSLRVNDFLHWSAILWAKQRGLSYYRLGPTFPEVPSDWPIARVSRFKAKFGGRPTTTIQGSFFRRPERYLDNGKRLLEEFCRARTTISVES